MTTETTTEAPVNHEERLIAIDGEDESQTARVDKYLLTELLSGFIPDPGVLLGNRSPGPYQCYWGDMTDEGIAITKDEGVTRVAFIQWPVISELVEYISSARAHDVWNAWQRVNARRGGGRR